MSSTVESLAAHLVRLLGGRGNLRDACNCMTRLRVHVADPALVDREGLGATPDVLGIQVQDDYVQVVLGPGKVKKVTDAVLALLGSPAESGPAGAAADERGEVSGPAGAAAPSGPAGAAAGFGGASAGSAGASAPTQAWQRNK